MARKDLMAVYGRLGLIMAAFALVVGIIAAPILPKFGTPAVVAAPELSRQGFPLS